MEFSNISKETTASSSMNAIKRLLGKKLFRPIQIYWPTTSKNGAGFWAQTSISVEKSLGWILLQLMLYKSAICLMEMRPIIVSPMIMNEFYQMSYLYNAKVSVKSNYKYYSRLFVGQWVMQVKDFRIIDKQTNQQPTSVLDQIRNPQNVQKFQVINSETMRLPIFIALLAFHFISANPKTIKFESHDVNQNWQWLSSQFNEIDQLTIANNELTEDQLIKVLSHQIPKLKKLGFSPEGEDIDFYMNQTSVLTPQIVTNIFKSKYFSRLKQLDLSETNINDNWLEFLENQSFNSSLEVLKLRKLRLGKKGYARLSQIKFNGLLRYLQLDGTLLIEIEAIQSLIKMICKFDDNRKCWNQLQVLSLQRTDIKREGFIKLIKNINSTALKTLKLTSAFLHYKKSYKERFNFTAYQALSNISFPNLQELQFDECGLNDEAMKFLQKWKLPQLKILTITANHITDEGFRLFVNKENMPLLNNLSIYGILIRDEGFKHLRQQNFSLKSLKFGDQKITERGLSQLKQMNLTALQRLTIDRLQVKPQEFYAFLAEISCSNLIELTISNMNDLANLISLFPWQKFIKLQNLIISGVQLADQYVGLSQKKSVLLPNLKRLVLHDTKMSFPEFNSILYMLPVIFPQLNRVKLAQQQQANLIIFRRLASTNFPIGTLLDFPYIKLRKAEKLYITYLDTYWYLIYGIDQQVNGYKNILALVCESVDFSLMYYTRINSEMQFYFFRILMQTAKMTQFPKLQQMRLFLEVDYEQFFKNLDQKSFPNLIKFEIHMTIPGDLEENLVYERLITFFTCFHKLNFLILDFIILYEDDGEQLRRKLLDNFHFPFLHYFISVQQNLKTEDLAQFINTHSMTLRGLNLQINFLQVGFFQLLAQKELVLVELYLSKIFFTVEQFVGFGKVSTEFLEILRLDQADLTNQHFQAFIKSKAPGPYFPKLKELFLIQNQIQREGLQCWLQTQMFNLQVILNERNYNPSFLNSLLKFPTKIRVISAQSFDIYSLDMDSYPSSVHQIKSLSISASSFTLQDFAVLGSLEFSHLQNSILQLTNIYDCEVLKHLLRFGKEASKFEIYLKMDKTGLNSSCLQGYQHQSNLKHIQIIDQYGTTYIDKYAELLANSTRNIQGLRLVRMRLPPSSLKIILSKNFHEASQIDLQHNYLDDQTFEILLKNQLQHLRILNLKSTLITSRSLVSLSKKKLPFLWYLDVSQNELDVSGISAIITIGMRLQYLGLNNCNLKGDSLNVLRNGTFWWLSQLNLDYNLFTEDEVFSFLTSLQRKNLPSLRRISLKGVPLSLPKYTEVQKNLTGKGFPQAQLDKPFNIPQSNAAKI